MLCAVLLALAADTPLFTDDFAKGALRWEPTDPKAWKVIDTKDGKAFSQHAQSKYKPPHRSPLNIALVKDLVVGGFVLEAKCRSTVKDYGHRDLCVFFGHQGPDRFYYVHLAKKADDRANQVFVVNKADRKKISKTSTDGTAWTDGWHDIKVVRKGASIEVFFDGKKVMTAEDDTFKWGRVGVGSFDDTGDWRDVKVYRTAVKPPG